MEREKWMGTWKESDGNVKSVRWMGHMERVKWYGHVVRMWWMGTWNELGECTHGKIKVCGYTVRARWVDIWKERSGWATWYE